VHFGADAVYTGSTYSLRSLTDIDDLYKAEQIIDYCHKKNVRVYITVNTFLFEREIQGYISHIRKAAELKPDAFIIADPGAVYIMREISPKIPIHLSTQANTLNSMAVKFWAENGIKRVNLGRELTLQDISEIRHKIQDTELEVFIHGALCLSISGKCLLSDFLTGNSANRGKCKHPCRWNYKIIEENRGRAVFYMENSKDFVSFFSPYDLMSLEFLPEIVELKINSLKIEGRMKGPFYTGMTVHAYRKNIDRIFDGKGIDPSDIDRLLFVTRRGYGQGFYKKDEERDLSITQFESIPGSEHCFLGVVSDIIFFRDCRYVLIMLKNNLELNTRCEIISPEGENIFLVEEMLDKDYSALNMAKPNSQVYIKIDNPSISINDIIYRLK